MIWSQPIEVQVRLMSKKSNFIFFESKALKFKIGFFNDLNTSFNKKTDYEQ